MSLRPGSPTTFGLRVDGRRGIVLIAVFALLWAILEEVVGARLQGNYDLLQVVWSRYAAHLALVFVIWGWSQPSRLWRTRRPVFHLTRSMMMLVMPVSFAFAVQRFGADPGTVWAGFWVAPLLVVCLAQWSPLERVPVWVWVAAAIGSLVAALMGGGLRPQPVMVFLLCASMTISFSLYVVMTRSLRHESMITNLFYTALGVFIALTPFVPAIWVQPSRHDAIVLMAVGAVGLVALLALDRAIEAAPVSRVVPVLHLQVVFVMLLRTLHGDGLTTAVVVGSAVIVGLAAYLWIQQPTLEMADLRLPSNPLTERAL